MAPLAEAFVRLRPDTTGFKTETEAKLAKFKIPVGLKLASGAVAAFRAEVDARVRDVTVKVKLKLDTTGLRGDIRDQFGNHTITVRPILDLTAFRAQYALFRNVYLRDVSFRVRPDLDENTLRRLLMPRLAAAGTQAGSTFGNGMASGFFKSKFTLIGGAIAALIPLLSNLMPIISQLITASTALGAALPFAITSAIAVAGTLKLALLGVNDAVKAVFANDPKKLAEAMAKLAPAARSFVLEIQTIRPLLTGLQQDIQQKFFLPLHGALLALAHSPAFAVLRQQLGGIATVAGRTASQILAVFTAAAKSGQLAAILAPVRESFAILGGVIPRLVGAFLTLAQAAAPFAKALTSQLVVGLGKFVDLVNKAAADGRLKALFDSGLSILTQLFSLLASVGSIIKSVFDAFAQVGGVTIGILGSLASQLAVFLRTAEGKQALVGFAQVLHDVGDVLGSAIRPLLPIVAAAFKVLAQVLIGVVGPLLPVVVKLVQALSGPLIDAVDELVAPLSNLAEVLAIAMLPIIKALAPVAVVLAKVIADFLVSAVGQLATWVQMLTPFLTKLAEEMGPHLVPIAEAFGKVLMALLPMLPGITDAIIALLPDLMKLIPIFVSVSDSIARVTVWIAQLIGWLSPMIGWFIKFAALNALGMFALMEKDIRFLGAAIGWLGDAVAWVVGEAKRQWGLFRADIDSLTAEARRQWKGFRDDINDVWHAIVAAWDWGWKSVVFIWHLIYDNVIAPTVTAYRATELAIRQILDAISVRWNNLKTNMSLAWTGIRDGVINPMIGFFTKTIPEAFGRAVTSIGSAWDRLRGAVAGPVNWLIANVVNKVSGVFNTVAHALGITGKDMPTFGGVVIQGASFADGGPVQRAAGGYIRGPGGPRDDKVPAWLSNGEFVIPAAIVKALGVDFFNELIGRRKSAGRNDKPGGYAAGGLVDAATLLMDIFSGPAAWVKGKMGNVLGQIPGAGLTREILAGMGGKLVSGLTDWITNHIGGAGFIKGVGGGGNPGTGAFTLHPNGWPPRVRHVLSPNTAAAGQFVRNTWHIPVYPDVMRNDPFDHPWGKANDNMTNWFNPLGRVIGNSVAGWFISNPGVFGTKYVIWNRQITSGSGWHPYVGDSTHQDHVHVSFFEKGGGVGARSIVPAGRGTVAGAGPVASYDQGGAWPTGTLGINMSGRTEHVSTAASMDRVADLLVQLIGAVNRVAPGVGREINGTATGLRQMARAR